MTALYGSLWRVLAGFLIAPAAASLALACYEPLYDGLPQIERVVRSAILFCLAGAYPLTLVFAAPIFFALRPRVQPTAVICTVSGAIIAAFPWLFQAVATSVPGLPYKFLGDVSVADVVKMALCGAGAGFLFWLIIAPATAKSASQPKPANYSPRGGNP